MVSKASSVGSVFIWRKASDDLLGNCVRVKLFGTDSHDAGLVAMGRGENRVEVRIVSKRNIVVCAGVGHDFRGRRVFTPNNDQCSASKPASVKTPGPHGGRGGRFMPWPT